MNTKIFTQIFNQIKPLFALLWFACILSAGQAVGQSTDWLSPSANTGTGGGVLLPENAYASDNAYAYFDMTSDNVVYSGFNINIPAGKVIKGVEIRVEGHKIPLSARDFKLSISWDGGLNFAGPKTTTGIPESLLDDATVYVGGAADNWGWNATTFNNFRIKVEVTSGWDYTDAIYLDLLQVRITYGDPNSQLFSSNASFTVPANVYSITVQAWGGGGAGGGSTTAPLFNYRAGAGGGGGAYVSKVLSVTPGTILSVMVGAAVSGSSGASGTNGKPSYIDGKQDLIYAAGGSGGTANTSGGSPAGGAGGSTANSKGDNVTAGGNGGNGASGGNVTSGAGGSGANGGGSGGTGVSSASNTLGANGNPGSAPGGGGSGSVSDGFTQTGGGGAAGRVIITWVECNTPAPAGDAAQTVCNSGTLASLAVSGSNIKWYSAATDGAELSSSTALVSGTTYYASQTINSCVSVDRLAVTVTLNKPDKPAGSETQSFCSAGTVGDLVATGTDVKWYNVASGGTFLNSTDALVNGYHYYASQMVNGCESVDRLDVTVSINSPLPPTGSTAQTFCNNATVADLKTGEGGIVGFGVSPVLVKWYDVASGGTELLATTPLVNGNTYYASGVQGACESLERLAVVVTINAPMAPEGPSPQNFCTSATVSNLSAAGTDIKWYNVATEGTALDGSTSLQSGAIYYASQTIDGCESIDRLAVEALIIAPGAPTGESIQTFCNSATLEQIQVNGFHISWYNADNVLLDHHTPVVNGQTYYAKQRIEGCQSVDKLAVTVMITTTPKPTGNGTQVFCNSAKVSDLVANGEGYILWYDEYQNLLSSDMPLTSGATYYASQILDECESADRLAVTVTINKPDPPAGDKDQTFCNSAKVSDLQPGGTNIRWYNAATEGTLLSADDALVDKKVYYAAQVVDNCESIERFAVTVTINAPSKPDGFTPQTFCNSATVGELKPGNGGIGITIMPLIQWYDVASGGKPLEESTPLVSENTYYATQTIDGCESLDRLAVTVTINKPSRPDGAATQTFCNSGKVSDLRPNGSSINWYDGEGALLNSETPLTNGAHYFASQTDNGCESIDRLDVTVVINTPPAPTGASAQTFCKGATVADLRPTSYGAGLVPVAGEIKWYNASGTLLNSTDVLVNGAHYFASQTIDDCESIGRLEVTVTISIPGITGTANVCAGSTTTLSGSPTAATLNPWTSSDETVATVNATGSVSGIKAGNVTITYTNSFGCTAQQAFEVKALPVPTFEVAPTTPGATGSGIAFKTQSGKSGYVWTITGPAYSVPSALCGYNKSGGTSASYSAVITWKEEGSKTVTVNYTENGCIGAAAATVTFDVCYPVSITTQPLSRTYQYTCEVPALGTDAVYKMCVLGSTVQVSDGITYQWYSNTANSFVGGIPILGATEKTYTPLAKGVGDYYYYAIATRKCQSDTTDIAHFKVDPAPVDPVEANYLYKGPIDAWTSGPTSNIASVPLLVHINNKAGQCGDITTARVTFLLNTSTGWTPIPGASNLPVNYIDPNVPSKGGAASTLAQFNIGSNVADVLDIKIVVSGNYTGTEFTSITIARPTPGGLICGAALLCNTNSTGFIKGATGNILLPYFSALNFYVAYNKSLKNPQGKVTLAVPSYNKPDGTVDKVLHWYVIRSNAISSLIVNKPTASFISKANVAEVLIDLNTLMITETLLEGNCKVVMDMTDGSPDKVGITVYRNKGGIWYANNWSGGKTVQQAVCMGSLTVTGVASELLTKAIPEPSIVAVVPFDVTIQSNPTSDQFILKVKGSLEPINIRVMDINGKVVEVRNHLAPGTPVYLGGNYIAGVYMAEVIQGPNRKMIKLVKQ